MFCIEFWGEIGNWNIGNWRQKKNGHLLKGRGHFFWIYRSRKSSL